MDFWNIQNLTPSLFPHPVSLFLLLRPETSTFFAHPITNLSGNVVGSTCKLYPESDLFPLIPLSPPHPSHCHLLLGILQWCINWSPYFYPCSTILPPRLFSKTAIRMMLLNRSQIMSLQLWWEKNLMQLPLLAIWYLSQSWLQLKVVLNCLLLRSLGTMENYGISLLIICYSSSIIYSTV